MKLLILTQKVDINDDLLGFFHGWIKELAKYCQKITVVCLGLGEYDLPDNVKALSLGKETNRSRLKHTINFYKYIWQERRSYDTVFVHMNAEYIILGGLFWRMLGKKVILWYAHGHVPVSLKIAEKLTNTIFTSTKSGCRIESKKIKVIGQGIDVDRFRPKGQETRNGRELRIVIIGRISPVKDYETLIRAVKILVGQGVDVRVNIIGGTGLPEHDKYLTELKEMTKRLGLKDIIKFIGPISNKDIVYYLQSADLFVSTSYTGSLDKAIAEAMACELPVLACNEALFEVLGDYSKQLMYPKGDYEKLAKKIRFIYDMEAIQRNEIGKDLRKIVVQKHSLSNFIRKIVEG